MNQMRIREELQSQPLCIHLLEEKKIRNAKSN